MLLNDMSEISNLVSEKVVAEQQQYSPLSGAADKNLEFPSEIMSGIAGEFAETYSNYLEPARHFFFMGFLACLGNVLGDKIKMASELDTAPRLYLLILGESADDRKSTAANKTILFFRDTMTEFPVCRGVGSAEGLQKLLSETPQMLLFLDEFKALVNKCKIESSVLLPCLTTLFESDNYENHTAKKEVNITGAALSILACSTIDTYEQVFDEHFLSIGFPNRIFLCPGSSERRFSFPGKIPTKIKVELQAGLAALIKHSESVREVDITPEARALYHAWYMGMPHSVHAKRLDTYALRLMPLLAVNDFKNVIDADVIQKVTTLMDWQYSVRRRYDPIDADNVMARVEEKLRRVLESGDRKKRDLQRAVHSNRIGSWIFDTALKNLIQGEEVSFDPKSKLYTLKKCHQPGHLDMVTL